jgi:hypothetical protein
MPRLRNTQSDPIDLCCSCWLPEAKAFEQYGHGPDGPDGRGNCYTYDDDAPDYDEAGYICENCRRPLTEPRDTLTSRGGTCRERTHPADNHNRDL